MQNVYKNKQTRKKCENVRIFVLFLFSHFQTSFPHNANSGPDFITACTAGNPDDQCASHTCMCEQTLIAEILNEAFEQSEPYSDMYLHSNGFDYEVECPKAALADAGAEAGSDCCGVYPKRFPMGANTEVSCCNDAVLFNPLVRDCCTDGSVMDAGSCPI